MRKSRRLGVIAAASGLLAAGGITVGLVATAHANVVNFCNGSGTTATCTVTATLNDPTAITVSVSATTTGNVSVDWSVACTDSTGSATTTGDPTDATPATITLTLPSTADGSCDVSAATSMVTTDSNNGTTVELQYTPASSPTATATATTAPSSGGLIVKGYANKCVDDNGNSSALRNKIAIWSCNNSDRAQLWHFASNGELQHNGMCANDKASGGNGSPVILYTCNGAANEIWSHLANGEFKLKARGGTVCLDDPAYSTKNGTALIVYACKDSANQRWYQP
jgi:hypothetical protein